RIALELLGEAPRRGDRVADLVGEACRQLPDGGQLLGMCEGALDPDGPGEEVCAVEQERQLIDETGERLAVVLPVDASEEPRAHEEVPPAPAWAVDRCQAEADARFEDRLTERERHVPQLRRSVGAARQREGGLSPWPHAQDR